MSNDTAKTITTNIVPVQGIFQPEPTFAPIALIGPAGTQFYAPTNPLQSGLTITNSTIDSSVIGGTTPAAGNFTTATATTQPVGANDLTTKLYVDALAAGISWKQPVLAGTLANITLSGAQTIDTIAVVAGDRVLVKNQSNAAENGIYIVASGAWSRSQDANTWAEVISAMVFIESGEQAGSAWYCSAQPGGTIGSTAMNWSNFSVAGTYYAGTGLTLSSNTFSITNTGVSANSYGSASSVPTFTVNAQGQLTAASSTAIAIAANQITSGTIDTARISGSYSGITGVGTLANLTVTNTITGSISGNAATATSATTAGSATTATTATNLAGGAAGSIPYQTAAGATTFRAVGTNGQILTLSGGLPVWANPATSGTVTSVGGTGSVSGITLSGTVTSSGNLTLGGSLDLSVPPAIGGTTPNTISGTTITATTKLVSPYLDAVNSAGGALRSSGGTSQLSWASSGDNLSLNVATNINPANASVSIAPTGTGSVTINPATAGTINNMSIGQTTAAAGTFTNINITGTLSLAGSTGTAGYVLKSNGASAPTWQADSSGLTISDDTTTNATRYITFTSATASNITTANVSSSRLTFNPNTGAFTATTLTPTNALGTNYGGTGLTSFTSGGAVYASSTSALTTGTLPISSGGTGATTLAGANIALFNTSQTFSASQRGTVTTDNDLSFDMNVTNNFKCTPSAGGALTFTNITAGQSGFILLINGSNYSITAAATTKVATGALTTISATGTYLLSYFSDGTNVYVVNSGALA